MTLKVIPQSNLLDKDGWLKVPKDAFMEYEEQ
jgi:hypothetical protein